MASRVGRSDQHNHCAAWTAREKGLTCPDCGSSDPVPESEVREHLHGGADIAMRCVNCDSASEVTLVLSPEEAKALGLHALRDRPESP